MFSYFVRKNLACLFSNTAGRHEPRSNRLYSRSAAKHAWQDLPGARNAVRSISARKYARLNIEPLPPLANKKYSIFVKREVGCELCSRVHAFG